MSLLPTDHPLVQAMLDTREAQGLPRHVEDLAILRQVADILRPVLEEQERLSRHRPRRRKNSAAGVRSAALWVGEAGGHGHDRPPI